jgi:acetyl esterase/lipase
MDCRLTSSFGLPSDIEEALRALGPRLDPAVIGKSREAFAQQRDLSLPEGGTRHADLRYGDHPRQTLDICQPNGEGHPIALFVPGGGFTGGDKSFYAHIPYFLARSGFVGAAVNYRLAPEFQWPHGASDVASALDWLAANGERFGGDPRRIVAIAQSAGAVHLSGALFDPRLRPACHGSIRAAALMSGLYDIRGGIVETVPLYFGADASQYADRSPVRWVARAKLPVLMTLAELDPPFFAPQAGALMAALTQRDGKAPPFAWLRGHNHLSPVLGMGGPRDRLGPAIVTEFQSHLGAD